MENNVLCYIQRKRLTDWKRLTITRKDSAWIFGSKDKTFFYEELKDGGILWIVSPISRRPPELVARISVKTVKRRDDPMLNDFGISSRLLYHFREWKWIAIGKENSEFFGHNNAGNALLETIFESPSGKPWLISIRAKKWHPKFGKKFQGPRKISSVSLNSNKTGVTALENLASTKSRSIFISWKWSDNSDKYIKSLAYALAENSFMPWLDLLALPVAKVSQQINENQIALEALLKYGYDRCFGILGVDTVNYGKRSIKYDKKKKKNKNWILREWKGRLSPEKKVVRIAYQPEGNSKSTILSNANIRILSINSL